MILTRAELESLIQATNPNPHQLLGMHALGGGTGVVVRAFLPNAAEVKLVPLQEKDKPEISLERQHKSGLFEGVSHQSNRVYAYELVITDHQGRVHRNRDPYSFLPTLSETDLYLFGQGNERRIYDKLGAQLRVIDGMAGTSFAVWAPNAQRVSVVGDFNGWDGRGGRRSVDGASAKAGRKDGCRESTTPFPRHHAAFNNTHQMVEDVGNRRDHHDAHDDNRRL